MNRILLVEDDEALCTGIALALGTPEVRLTACRTLAAARAALAGQSFELLILDVNLPDGSALDLVRGLRPRDPVPVLLLTANDLEVDIVNGLEAGADDYVTKPFSLAVLRARVAGRAGQTVPAGQTTLRESGIPLSGGSFCCDAFSCRRGVSPRPGGGRVLPRRRPAVPWCGPAPGPGTAR